MAPWADVLYACDHVWWERYKGVPKFQGLKISQDSHPINPAWDIKQIHVVKGDDRMQFMRYGVVGWAGNGGFHAMNMAVQFGVRKIVLVGYDMRVDLGVHWHGKHPHSLNNPDKKNVERWRRCVDAAAPVVSGLGVEVINASAVSALENYPKMSFEEAIECRC